MPSAECRVGRKPSVVLSQHSVLSTQHSLGRVERKAAGEHGEPAEEGLLGRIEEVVTPLDGGTHRLQAGRKVAGSARQQRQPRPEPGEHRFRREDGHPRRRQLDGERQAVEAAAKLADGGGVRFGYGEIRVGRFRPRDEETNGRRVDGVGSTRLAMRIGQRQRWDGHDALGRKAEAGAAGDEQREPGARD